MKKCVEIWISLLLMLVILVGCSKEQAVSEDLDQEQRINLQDAPLEEELQEEGKPADINEYFSTMDEFLQAVDNAQSSTYVRTDIEPDKAGLSELEQYFVADRIPEGYELFNVFCSDTCISYHYYPEEGSLGYRDDGREPADISRVSFFFMFDRTEARSLADEMERLNATEADLLEGKFLLDVKRRTYYWEQEGKRLQMRIPENWDFFVTDVESICHAQTVYVNPPEE